MKKTKMDCRLFEEMIPDFVEDKLGIEEAEEFLQHMDECAECREELHIQYLVREGINRLEDGDTFNLNRELNLKIKEYSKYYKYKKQATIALYALEAIAVVATVVLIALVIITR